MARQRYRAVRDQASREVAAAIDRYEQGGQPPAIEQQREGVTARGSFQQERDTYGNLENIITLMENADLSTFLHEGGHFWLFQMKQDLDSDYLTDEGRALFTDTFKTKANISKIDAVWQEYTDGKITEDEARDQIEALAGGVGAPFWADIGPGDSVYAEDGNATYEGKLSAAERREEALRPGRAGDTGRPELEQQVAGTDPLFQEVDFVGDVIFEVAPDPNNVELSSRWNALPPEVKLSISDAVSNTQQPINLARSRLRRQLPIIYSRVRPGR